MKALTLTVWLLALPLSVAQADFSMKRNGYRRFNEGEVIVRFSKDYAKVSQHRGMVQAAGAERIRTLDGNGLVHLKTRFGQTVDEAVKEFSQLPGVVSAQPNFRYFKLDTPNDPQYGSLWGLKNTGQTIRSPLTQTVGATLYPTSNPGTAGKDMNLEAAWALIKDCSAITVAVIDTGVNYNHQDLVGNLWDGGASYPNHGYNFVDKNNDPMDLNGHGTHVAGIIGAVGNNGIGTTGVCWKVKIMAVRVMDAMGSGSTADIIAGINFAVDHQARVLNMSFGQSDYDSALEGALKYASGQGVVAIAAAGNDGVNNDAGTTPTYPCNYQLPNLLCVAALDQSFQLATFSNWGATSVAVGAPGTNVVSLWTGANVEITDSFNSNKVLNWQTNGNWGYSQKTFKSSGNTYDFLQSPSNWDGSTVKYPNNLDARVYKSFNLSSYRAATADFYFFLETQSRVDYFNIGCSSAGGDPFNGTGVSVDRLSGSTSGYSMYEEVDITPCLSATTAMGFQLTSDGTTTATGVALYVFSITGLNLNDNSYARLDGTSMATPYVAGLAALVQAYNPSYQVTDVLDAIKGGGVATPALSGKTQTGKAVNALGALQYLTQTTGVRATVQ